MTHKEKRTLIILTLVLAFLFGVLMLWMQRQGGRLSSEDDYQVKAPIPHTPGEIQTILEDLTKKSREEFLRASGTTSSSWTEALKKKTTENLNTLETLKESQETKPPTEEELAKQAQRKKSLDLLKQLRASEETGKN